MKGQFRTGLPQFLVATISLFLLWGGGCGGGTRGSGGQLFEGVVSDSNARSLSGVSVTILSTGDSSITDNNGAFTISTNDVSGGVEFLLEAQQFSGRVITQEVPQDATRVFVKFTVGSGSSPTITSDIEVKDRIPTPTAAPRATATPRATMTPIGIPAAPTPQPTQGGSGSTGPDDSSDDNDDQDQNDDDDDQVGGSGPTGGSGPIGGSGGSGGSGPNDDDDNKDDDDDSNNGGLKDGATVDVEGKISGITGNSVTVGTTTFVAVPSTEYRDDDGQRSSLSSFKVGDDVDARGRVRSGVIELERLEKD